ncbi:MAG: hypothetical protein J6P16_07340, partial [Eubacterium sp.]|nr:hypothetical protein [Eubacterium sp.]
MTDALSSNRDLNIMLSHMSEETYIDEKVNWDFYKKCNMLNIDAPIEFISDTMLYDGTKNNGSTPIYENYGGVPAIYVYLINLRNYLYKEAERLRTTCELTQAAAVMYVDRWIEDLDNATDALVRCFNSMANRMVTEKDPNMVSIITGEITTWFTTYGKYITPLPDLAIDITEAGVKALIEEIIKGFDFVEDTDKLKSEQIKSLALTHIGVPGLDEAIRKYTTRMNDPEVQLDFSQNPFSPADKNEGGNFKEFKSFISSFENEGAGFNAKSYNDIINGTDGGALDDALDSDFEAFYNAIVMFKLILIGPDNFSDFIKSVVGVEQTQYQKKTTELRATSLKLDIKTADTSTAGTDDNIFAVVYDKSKSESEPIIKKLLEKSGKNDFEIGSRDTYTVELGGAVKLSNIEVEIKKEGTSTAAPDWDCESIYITPYHAGAALTDPIGFGGRYEMKNGDTWKLFFNEELKLRTQISEKWNTLHPLSAEVTIETGSGLGDGTDDSVTLEIYSEDVLKKRILLDKYNYNDFEMGCKDTYNVPLAENLADAIPLENLNMKINCSGTTDTGAWKIKSVDIRLFHGEIELTEKISRGEQTLKESTWDLIITGGLTRKACSGTSLALSYETEVDDGMLDFVYSLDGSHQYANSNGILWGNSDIRGAVFFNIFKGFRPGIEYVGDKKEIVEGYALDMDFTLEGMWNGVSQSRRDQVYFDPATAPDNGDDYQKMPSVGGTAKISFINSKGSVVCSVDQTVSDGKIQLKGYIENSLTPGTYSVRVKYEPGSDPMYAAAEKEFKDKLTVYAPAVVKTAPIPKTDLVFEGTAQALVDAGVAENGTMVYAVVKAGDTEPSAELYTTSIPTAVGAGTYDVWYMVKGDAKRNDTKPQKTQVSIAKAEHPEQRITAKAKSGESGSVDLSKMVAPGGALGNVTVISGSGILDGTPALSGEKLPFTFNTGAAAGQKAEIEVGVNGCANYNDYSIKITLEVTDKPVPLVSASSITVTYNGAPVDASKIKGTATVSENGKTVSISGSWTFAEGQKLTDVKDSGGKKVIFTPNDKTTYETVEVMLELKIKKADISGAPTFTKVTASGKKLGDTNLSVGTLSIKDGTLSWDDGADTVIIQGRSYGWTFTPDDENYAVKTGKFIPWAKSQGGSSGGSGSSSGSIDSGTPTASPAPSETPAPSAAPEASPAPSTAPEASPAPSAAPGTSSAPTIVEQKTETTKNPDGSTTTTTTTLDSAGTKKTESETVRPDGTVEKSTETIKAYGTTEKVTESVKPDGSSVIKTEIVSADGSTEKITEKTKPNGSSEKVTDIEKANGATIHEEVKTTAKGKETSQKIETSASGSVKITEQVKQPSGD